jgi:hypothetical protein
VRPTTRRSHAPAQGASVAAAQRAYSAQKHFLNDRRPCLLSNLRVGFEGAASISRKDWGASYNSALETGGVLIRDRIKLQFAVSAIAAHPAPEL